MIHRFTAEKRFSIVALLLLAVLTICPMAHAYSGADLKKELLVHVQKNNRAAAQALIKKHAQNVTYGHTPVVGLIYSDAKKIQEREAKIGETMFIYGSVDGISDDAILVSILNHHGNFNILGSMQFVIKTRKDLGLVDGDRIFCAVTLSKPYSFTDQLGKKVTMRAGDLKMVIE